MYALSYRAHSPGMHHFFIHHVKVYKSVFNGGYQQQGSCTVAEYVTDLRVTETILSRIVRPKTQQAGMLIYELGSGKEESGSEN